MRTIKFLCRVLSICVWTKGYPVMCVTYNGKENTVLIPGAKHLTDKECIEHLAGQLEDNAIHLRDGTVTVVVIK